MEPTTALILGAICLALAVASGAYAGSVRRTAQAMIDTPTTPAGKITSSGYYEVKGKVRCASPLSAPRSGRPCVFFHHRAQEQREVRRRNAEGDYETDYEWHTVVDETQHCTFEIEDTSGKVRVLARDASLEGVRTTKHTDNPDYSRGGGLFGTGDRRLGWRESITAIHVDERIYAIGQVEQHPDGLTMDRAGPDGKPFVVSVKSEEEQVEEAQSSFNFAVVAAVLLGGGGLILLLMGLSGR